jgi:hypothetical protein
MKKKIIYLIIGFIIFCLLLLIFDTKVLMYESKGISYYDPFKKTKNETLDCKYFTGRNFVSRNIPISSRDTCPFLTKE